MIYNSVSELWVSLCIYATLYCHLDQHTGSLDFCGCLILFVTSLPAITDGSVKLVGFILAIILIGLRTGSVKATITPFISEPLFKSANSQSKNINLLYDLNRGLISKYIPIGNNHKSR